MSKQKKKTMKNTPKTMRGEKVKDASKLSSQSPQIGNKMKQKYIQRLKDRPKSKEERTSQTTEQTDTQAIEQVQDSGQWAAAELAGTTGRMIRQEREYAKRKAKTANGNFFSYLEKQPFAFVVIVEASKGLFRGRTGT